MKLNNYINFNESRIDKIFEQFVNESIVYYSPRLREIFKKVKDDISYSLLDIEKVDIKDDITFIDIDESNPNYLTFTRMSKVIKNIKSDEDYKDWKGIEILTTTDPKMLQKVLGSNNNPLMFSDFIFTRNIGNILTKDRNPIKMTRLINKLIGSKFSPDQIDTFSRKVVAKFNKEDYTFKLVEGDDIAFWYKKENYSELKGTLGSSCMKNVSSNYFDIYTKNPNICKLLILVDDKNKLVGRALVWTITKHNPNIKDNLIFMDRQYTIDETDTQRFKDYAKKQGWSYKAKNSIGDVKMVTYNDERFDIDMEISIDDTYESYPYMDTFKRYSPDTNKLYNDTNDNYDNKGDYILEDTGGGFHLIGNDTVWSEYEDREISQGDEIWSDEVSSYLHIDNAIQVTTGSRNNRGWYPEGYDELVYDEQLEEYIHINDSVYSDWYDSYLVDDSAVKAIIEIDSDGEPNNTSYISESDDDFIYNGSYDSTHWFKRLSSEYSEWEDNPYIKKSLLFLNFENEYSLLIFKITIYKISELSDEANEVGLTNDNYLTELDANLLKCKIDKTKSLTTDKFHYHYILEDFLQNYYNYLQKRLEEIDIILKEEQKLIDFDDNPEYLKKLKMLYKSIDDRSDDIKDGKYNDDVRINDI